MPVKPAPWALVLVAATFPLTASPAVAQAPGYPPVPIGQVRAEYVAEVLDRINDLLADWGTHWAGDDLEQLVDMYWEDALVITPDGTTHRGREDLRGYFVTALPTMGTVEAFMLDFDASGQMAQVFGNYLLEVDGGQIRGPMLTVYVRRSRRWRIRSQVFLPPPG